MSYFDAIIASIATVLVISIIFFVWAMSASTIATECEKLGAFYVGSKVYKC